MFHLVWRLMMTEPLHVPNTTGPMTTLKMKCRLQKRKLRLRDGGSILKMAPSV
jgi:hypothetical protein